jgi:hypothetical protein
MLLVLVTFNPCVSSFLHANSKAALKCKLARCVRSVIIGDKLGKMDYLVEHSFVYIGGI